MENVENDVKIKVKILPFKFEADKKIFPVKFTIENFTEDKKEKIGSEIFEIKHRNKTTKWIMIICPYLKDDTMCFYIQSENNTEVNNNKQQFSLYVIDSHGAKNSGLSESLKRTSHHLFEIERHKIFLPEVIYHDKLKLLMEFEYTDGNYVNPSNNGLKLAKTQPIFKNREFCDLTLIVQEKEIKVHKILLASRSSHFHKLLTEIGFQQSLLMNDFSFEVMEDLISYLYGDGIKNITKNVTKLYQAAIRYKIEDLQEVCTVQMIENCTVENVTEIIKIVRWDNLSTKKVLQNALKFAKRNIEELLESNGNFIKILIEDRKVRTILCEKLIKYLPEFEKIEYEDPFGTQDKKILVDFEKLFVSQKYSDVTLETPGGKILAHKNILISRSPVFEAMFEHDTSEAQKNVVKIEDVEHQIMQALVKFIYCEKVDVTEELAVEDLMIAADKYQIEDLTEKCVQYLLETMSVKNVINYLIAADLVNSEQLTETAMHFIGVNFEVLSGTVEWEEFVKKKPELFAAVLLDWNEY